MLPPAPKPYVGLAGVISLPSEEAWRAFERGTLAGTDHGCYCSLLLTNNFLIYHIFLPRTAPSLTWTRHWQWCSPALLRGPSLARAWGATRNLLPMPSSLNYLWAEPCLADVTCTKPLYVIDNVVFCTLNICAVKGLEKDEFLLLLLEEEAKRDLWLHTCFFRNS